MKILAKYLFLITLGILLLSPVSPILSAEAEEKIDWNRFGIEGKEISGNHNGGFLQVEVKVKGK